MHIIVMAFLILALSHSVIGAPLLPQPVSDSELSCMTDNIYFEARSEPILGQIEVGKVVLNRVKDPRWKNDVCGVVYEKSQFSWTLEKRRKVRDEETYKFIKTLAYQLLASRESVDLSGANHYLRCDWREGHGVTWWKRMEFVGQIGAHCFYKGY